MNLHVIGSGCPDPRAERFGSAFVLGTNDERILVDCGPGTTYKVARMGLHPLQVGHLFLTHHHSDHNADVPCFLLTWWDQSAGDETPLAIYGPPPTEAFVDKLIGAQGAFRSDIESRLQHPASHECHRIRNGVTPRPAPGFPVRDLEDGAVIEAPGWRVRAVAVQHVEPTLLSLAYRFDTTAGSIVFAGDCADCPSLRELATDADTLVVCCTHFGAPTVSQAIVDCVPGVQEVGSIANHANIGRIVLTHMSRNFEGPEIRRRAVAAVEANCDSEVLCPDELSTVSL